MLQRIASASMALTLSRLARSTNSISSVRNGDSICWSRNLQQEQRITGLAQQFDRLPSKRRSKDVLSGETDRQRGKQSTDHSDRQSGELLWTLGHGKGLFFDDQIFDAIHVAVDSKGNVYVAEDEGRRLTRFKIVEQ